MAALAVKEEEKVEAWMVSLAVVVEPEESFDEEMDIPESQSYLDENFDEEFTITDNLSDKIEYVPIKEEAYVTTYKPTVLRGTPGVLPTNIDLYDSGASCHMSGFHHRFIKLVKITPKPITAADRRSFSAIGKGDIWVYLPNGKEKLS